MTDTRRSHQKLPMNNRALLESLEQSTRELPMVLQALIGQHREILDEMERLTKTNETLAQTNRLTAGTIARLLRENDALRHMLAQYMIGQLNPETHAQKAERLRRQLGEHTHHGH